MTAKELAAILAVGAAAVAGGIIISQSGTNEVQPVVYEKIKATQLVSPKTLDSKQKIVSPSKLAVVNGLKSYFVQVQTDAGVEKRVLLPTKARRNPKIGPECYITLVDGGVADPGDYNRFDSSKATGKDCQLVADSVYFGQDANSDEDASRKR